LICSLTSLTQLLVEQSVSDVEHLFSKSIENFTSRRVYNAETKYIRVMRNWESTIGIV